MIRSLKKEQSSLYFQYENTAHNLGVKICESEIKDALAILRFTLSSESSDQSQNRKYLKEERLVLVCIDDKTIIDGFLSHMKSANTISSYTLELRSQNDIFIFDVSPVINEQGDFRALYLNVKNT